MNRTTIKTLTIAATLLLSGAAYAAHWDRPSCYIDVHSGCFLTGGTPCSQEEYEEFLDMCDVAYPASVRLPIGGLVAPGNPPGPRLTR